MNTQIAVIANWLVLLACLISAGNACEPLSDQRELERLAGNPMVHVRGHGAARRALHAQDERARSRRSHLRHGVRAHAHLDRHHRRVPVPAADLRDPHLFHVAVVRRVLARAMRPPRMPAD